MDQTHQTLSFDPFKERIATVRQQLSDAHVILDSLAVETDLRQAAKIDDQRRKKIAEALELDNGTRTNVHTRRTQRRVAGIKSQLSVGITLIEAMMHELEKAIDLVQGAIERQDYGAGVLAMETVQAQFEQTCLKPLEALLNLVHQRAGENGLREVEVIDLMISTLYGAVAHRAARAQLTSKESVHLTPICWVDQSDTRANLRIGTDSAFMARVGVPVSMVPVDEDISSEPWRCVLAYHPIAAQLYVDLMLDSEMSTLLLPMGANLPPGATAILTAARVELIADAVAVLLAGPAYVGALIERLLDRPDVVAGGADPGRSRVAPYVRWVVACAVLEQMGFQQEAMTYRGVIERFYGTPEVVSRFPPAQPFLNELITAASSFVGAALAQPLQVLQGHTLFQLLPVLDRPTWQRAEEEAERLSGSLERSSDRRAKGSGRRDDSHEASRHHARKSSGTSEESSASGVPTVILAARIAFERASADGKDLAALARAVRQTNRSFIESHYSSGHGQQLSRELNEEEVLKLVRQLVPPGGPETRGDGTGRHFKHQRH